MWTIDITAPNGAKGQLVLADATDDTAIAEQVRSFAETARANDPQQMAGVAGTAPSTQERRTA